MEEKEETVAAYDAHAERFDAEYERHLRRYNIAHADAFLSALPGRSILDLGCGPGNHAAYFRAKGFDPLCGDLSAGMLDLCRRKGLPTVRLDIEAFGLPETFDGIWANACLLHLRKADVPAALDRIVRHLEPGGVLGCAVKHGAGERMEADPEYPGTRRRFSYFGALEFADLLAEKFLLEAFDCTVTATRKTAFLKYIARRKPSS